MTPHTRDCAGPAHAGVRTGRIKAAVALVLMVHAGCLTWAGYKDSATWDEVGHFAAGLSHWQDGDFALYRVNPPLVRLIATLPISLCQPTLDVGPYLPDLPNASPTIRDDFTCGERLARTLGERYFGLLTLARWALVPLCILGGWVCYLWAADLFGPRAGLLAAALWASCPNVLAYGHLITPDAGAAALGVAAAYLFWKWLQRPAWRRAAAAGAVLGLAQLTKTTWLFLFGLWPAVWLGNLMLRGGVTHLLRSKREGLQLVAMMGLAIVVLNLGYGYDGSFRPLGSYVFASRAMAGPGAPSGSGRNPEPGNRFADTWAGQLPVPLPSSYLRGIDYIKWEFESKAWSYFRGEWRLGGWWYYYLYGLLVKVPVGTWALLATAIALSVLRRGYSAPGRDELLVLLPAAVVLVLVSSQTGFNHHIRYVLPALPFLFIWMSKVARSIELMHRGVTAAVAAALGWSVLSSFSVFPHSMSYFNEVAGGPKNGHYHLGNSNTDWGQDLLYLKRWYDRHPEARPLHLGYDLPLIDPRMLGIDWRPLPVGPSSTDAGNTPADRMGPRPGWYAISVNQLHTGGHHYDYFHDLEPVDWVGYTLPVYEISLGQANALRRRYGLPELPARPATIPVAGAAGAGERQRGHAAGGSTP
jgi:4-amino-4-deoxy-L-arabinose transferase-like glycosyltransferase